MSISGNNRLSNFELLRIICIFSILCSHILYHGCDRLLLDNCANNFSMGIQSFLGFHVNAFLLISGYFGIKLKANSFFRFFITCAFYSVAIWIVFSLFSETSLSFMAFLKRFHFFYRNSPWWFVEIYFYLFVTAPILNMAFSANRKNVILFLCLLTFLNIVCGGILHSDYNLNGFNYNHFVYMYFIGVSIRYFDFNVNRKKCIYSILIVSILIFLERHYLGSFRGYINPLVVLQSVLVFLFFKGINIKSSFLNNISASTFAVYLMHDEDVYARKALVDLVEQIYALFSATHYPGYMFIILMVFFSFVAFIGLICVDRLLRFIFINHLINQTNHLYKTISKKIYYELNH